MPTDTLSNSSHTRGWVRGAAWVASGITATAIVWWLTGADIFYAVVVAFVALGALDGPLAPRRALTHLASAAGLVLIGALVFPRLGIGESAPSRIAQGTGGLAAAALTLLVVATVRRSRSRRERPIEG